MRQKELFKEEIIHQLELHPSRLDKEKIISEAMEQGLDDFFDGIRMALDPLVTFGVKIVPEKENEKSQNFLWKDFKELAKKLIQRENLLVTLLAMQFLLLWNLQQKESGMDFIDEF